MSEKDPAAVELGRRGGKVGGKARVPKGFALMKKSKLRKVAKAGGKASAAARQAK